jgi:hypothetical protein
MFPPKPIGQQGILIAIAFWLKASYANLLPVPSGKRVLSSGKVSGSHGKKSFTT